MASHEHIKMEKTMLGEIKIGVFFEVVDMAVLNKALGNGFDLVLADSNQGRSFLSERACQLYPKTGQQKVLLSQKLGEYGWFTFGPISLMVTGLKPEDAMSQLRTIFKGARFENALTGETLT